MAAPFIDEDENLPACELPFHSPDDEAAQAVKAFTHVTGLSVQQIAMFRSKTKYYRKLISLPISFKINMLRIKPDSIGIEQFYTLTVTSSPCLHRTKSSFPASLLLTNPVLKSGMFDLLRFASPHRRTLTTAHSEGIPISTHTSVLLSSSLNVCRKDIIRTKAR